MVQYSTLTAVPVPAGDGHASRILLIRVHHAVQGGHIPAGVSYDGVGEVLQLVVGNDVLDPALVGLCRVAG